MCVDGGTWAGGTWAGGTWAGGTWAASIFGDPLRAAASAGACTMQRR